jgi:hypothetical protein
VNRLTSIPFPMPVTRTPNGKGWSTLSWYGTVREFYNSRTAIDGYVMCTPE